jgi:hypothetical protein
MLRSLRSLEAWAEYHQALVLRRDILKSTVKKVDDEHKMSKAFIIMKNFKATS